MAYLYLAEKLKKRYPALTPGIDWDVVATSDNASVNIVWRVNGQPAPTKESIDGLYTDDEIQQELSSGRKNGLSNTLPTAVQALAAVLEVRLGLPPNTLINEIKAEIKK